jgi:hypothetical protein
MYLFITGIDSAGSVFITKETLSANRIKIRIVTFYHHFQQYLSYIMAVIPLTEETVMSRENYIFLQVIDLKPADSLAENNRQHLISPGNHLMIRNKVSNIFSLQKRYLILFYRYFYIITSFAEQTNKNVSYIVKSKFKMKHKHLIIAIHCYEWMFVSFAFYLDKLIILANEMNCNSYTMIILNI